MNILFVTKSNLTSSFQPGRRIELPKKLAELKHSVSLISACYTESKPEIENASYDQIKLIPIGDSPFIMSIIYGWKMVFALLSYLFTEKRKPDVVIFDIASILPSLLAVYLSRLLRNSSKFILDIRTVPVENRGVKGFLKNFEYTLAIWLAKYFYDGLTVITCQLRDDIVKQYKINPQAIGIWSSGVSLESFDPSKASIPDDVINLQNKFVVMNHGVMGLNRGLQEAIDAISILHNDYPDIVLLFIGDGPAVEELKSKVQDGHLEGNVFIHDPVSYDIVRNFISVANVGLIPLPNIGWWRASSPQKLMEYLAMEKPVIITDIPAHRNVIQSSACGFYLTSIEPSEIAHAIRDAYLHKTELKEWGKIGRKIIENGFTWDTQALNLSNYLVKVSNQETSLR